MVTIKFESELATFKENLNQVSSVSLLMTSSTALVNKGLFELTRSSLLACAVLLFFAETPKANFNEWEETSRDEWGNDIG